MIRSKIIPVTLAAFCGLALQFHGSSANAQTPVFGTADNTDNMYVTAGYSQYVDSQPLCSPVVGNCLVVEPNGNVVLYSYENVPLWSSSTDTNPTENPIFYNFIKFLPSGDMLIASDCDCPVVYSVHFDTGTNQGGSEDWSGYQGWSLAVQDDGNLVLRDYYLNVLWEATYDSTYNWTEASNVKQVCYQWGGCW